MRPERERVKALLTEAVTLLCKNSVTFQAEVEVEGLLGITVDKTEVFLVSLKEIINKVQPMPLQPVYHHQQHHQMYSPGPKRKRRRKSMDNTLQKPTPITNQSQPQPTDITDPIVLEDDDVSNGTVDYDLQQSNTGGKQNESHGELYQSATEDSTANNQNRSEFEGMTDPSKHSGEVLEKTNNDTGNSNTHNDSNQGDKAPTGQLGDNMVPTVKQEKLEAYGHCDPDLVAFDPFEHEQKWSANMDILQVDESFSESATGFSMAPHPSTSQVSPSNQAVKGKRPLKNIMTAASSLEEFGKLKSSSEFEDTSNMICQISGCFLQFSSPTQLFYHQISCSHFTDYCALCDKTFSHVQKLKRHVESVHAGSQFHCRVCSKVFNRVDNMRAHESAVHGISVCRSCNGIFMSKQELADHMKAVHLSKK